MATHVHFDLLLANEKNTLDIMISELLVSGYRGSEIDLRDKRFQFRNVRRGRSVRCPPVRRDRFYVFCDMRTTI